MSFIYVMRHELSVANENPALYNEYKNKDIPLANPVKSQAITTGELIRDDISKRCPVIGSIEHTSCISSPYLRCVDTANLVTQGMGLGRIIKTNMLLSETSFGDQEGCNVEEYRERPVEHLFKERMGSLHYRPNRAESYLDVHTRMGLFVVQQKFFGNHTIIVSHASACLMLHYFLTETCPKEEILDMPATKYWNNGIVRKYSHVTQYGEETQNFHYDGILQGGEDVLSIPRAAGPGTL